MTFQGMVEAATNEGANDILLTQQLNRHLDLAESLWTAMRVHLDAIPSAEEALRDLGTFDFVALHLFSMRRRHSSAVVELLRLIDRLEELHTEVQGMISYSHLSTIIMYDVFLWWSLYLNMCVDALVLEALEYLEVNAPFSIDPILVDLEGGGARLAPSFPFTS